MRAICCLCHELFHDFVGKKQISRFTWLVSYVNLVCCSMLIGIMRRRWSTFPCVLKELWQNLWFDINLFLNEKDENKFWQKLRKKLITREHFPQVSIGLNLDLDHKYAAVRPSEFRFPSSLKQTFSSISRSTEWNKTLSVRNETNRLVVKEDRLLKNKSNEQDEEAEVKEKEQIEEAGVLHRRIIVQLVD